MFHKHQSKLLFILLIPDALNGFVTLYYTGCPKKTITLLIGIYFYITTSTDMYLT